MTTPSNSPEEGTEGTPAPAEPAEPATPAEATTAFGPAVPPAPAQPVYQGPPPGYPFAPIARPPRTPWVNPARRGHVAAAAIVGALVFGAGGLLIGHAVSDHGNSHGERHIVRMGPGEGMNVPGYGRGQYPRRPYGPGQQGPNGPNEQSPSNVPSSSPTK